MNLPKIAQINLPFIFLGVLSSLFLIGIAGGATGGVNPANPANEDPSAPPYISIDPMTNLTVGNIFFINGTTNLPANDSLSLTIFQFSTMCELRDNPRPTAMTVMKREMASEKISSIVIVPDHTGKNRFSVNVTDSMKDLASNDYGILMYQWPSRYLVWASSGNVTSAAGENFDAGCDSGFPPADFFTLYSSHPYLSIDWIMNHPFDEVFFIKGTTDIPAGENLTILINGSGFDPKGHASYFASSAMVEMGTIPGENIWSCNVTPALWTTFSKQHEQSNDMNMVGLGDYTATVKNEKFHVNQSQTFNIFANATIKPSMPSKSPTASHATPLSLISILSAIAGVPIAQWIGGKVNKASH